jgi:outer membrane receptor protein involved in Fe transport
VKDDAPLLRKTIEDAVAVSDLVVINAGLRYDYLNVDTKALRDPGRPLGEDNFYLDDADLVDNKVQHALSPRIGVGFPISERTLFHVNYGKFFQPSARV